ncbi:hypothetical protein BGW39_003489 [Mortierella sp. 14UC]|nr:hypothetical protein BGW39_003489 [Mortierella sp. 14UC]
MPARTMPARTMSVRTPFDLPVIWLHVDSLVTAFRLMDSIGAIVPKFCIIIAQVISKIAFYYVYVSTETILAILLHQSSLEKAKVCKNLETLRVRIRGIDTKEMVLELIAQWSKGCWMRRQVKDSQAPGTTVKTEESQNQVDLSIEDGVARHLLKFDNLESVWL